MWIQHTKDFFQQKPKNCVEQENHPENLHLRWLNTLVFYCRQCWQEWIKSPKWSTYVTPSILDGSLSMKSKAHAITTHPFTKPQQDGIKGIILFQHPRVMHFDCASTSMANASSPLLNCNLLNQSVISIKSWTSLTYAHLSWRKSSKQTCIS